MYTLQRTGDVFRIQREGPGRPGDAQSRRGQALPSRMLESRQFESRVNLSQWQEFMETGVLFHPACDEKVLASWKRCREWNVDPSPRSCWDFTPVEQLEPFAGTLQRIGGGVIPRVYEAIKGRNLLLTVADHNSRLVRTCGDLDTLRKADKLNFGPGANWAEASVGTNAIGTAIATGLPMQVFAEEHYCQSHHAWCCTAAPIFDPKGDIWGCIDISGPTQSDHSRSLRLVLDAARELERQLSAAYLQELEHKSRSLISAVFNAVLTGVLTVDEQGRITNANQAAAALLGMPLDALRGLPADAVLDYRAFVSRQRRPSDADEAMTIACRKNPQLIARAAPVGTVGTGGTGAPGGTGTPGGTGGAEPGKWGHTIVTLTEPQRTRTVSRPASWSSPSPSQGAELSSTPDTTTEFGHIIGRSPALLKAVKQARQAARTPSTVLLTGETGTGKELFAQGIHQASARAAGPFVAVNCGALARDLAQSELFGYRAGSFTGADDKGRTGKFEQAHKGTLFLDEISEMPLELQVNLLRPLEERCVVRVGGSKPRPLDVKVVAATNKDLQELVRQGRFREDLFYRIHVVAIRIPPLRERPEDIPLLTEHHARRLCAAFGLPYQGIEAAAMARLCEHPWPGNVRELVNCVEYAVNQMEDGLVRAEHLPPRLGDGATPSPAAAAPASGLPLPGLSLPGVPLPGVPLPGVPLSGVPLSGVPQALASTAPTLEDAAQETIRAALARHGGNVSQAARALGIGRNTLYAKMRKFGLC